MEPQVRAALQAALPAYEVDGELGRGAFGVVYAARHTQLGRDVAIKELPAAFAADPVVRGRFVSEAQMVASLDHPHIVPVYDFVENESACLLIMERCTNSVGDRFKSEGIATDEACAAVLACLAALDFAHGRGLLHRDVKPENLMYDTKGTVKLADFGIARALDSDIRQTATGMVVGTPAYMSPEQVRGDELTPASDVYSVAMMAYELLTGALPFPESPSVTGLLAHHLVTEPFPLLTTRPELPGAIGTVIDRALAKDLVVRQGSAAELADELARACVTAFGSGWLRRRRFILHWPDIVAITEGPAPDSPRTGTILVRAPNAPHEVITPSEALADADARPGPPTTPPAPPSPPPPGSPQPPGPAEPAAPAPPTGANAGRQQSSRRTPWILGAAAALTIVALAGIALFVVGGSDDDATSGDTTTPSPSADSSADPAVADLPTSDPATEAEATPTTTPVSTAPIDLSGTPADSPDFSNRPEGYAPRVADSWLTPTPCPEDQPRVACIVAGIAFDEETGEVTLAFFTEGFVPQLEPAGHHVHFYFDSSVAGDENRAGSAVPGGEYRPWDLPFLVMSSNGEMGRTMYTLADAEAADARFLCSIVADPEQVAIPDSGNCAPVPRLWNDDVRVQLERLTGEFIGSCAVDAVAIVPGGWIWVDLTDTTSDEAAELLTPTAVAETSSLLEDIEADGGVVFARGVFGDGSDTAEVVLSTLAGDFEYDDTPEIVIERLALLGIDATDAAVEQHGGREIATLTSSDGESVTKRFVYPDAGLAVELAVTTAAVAAGDGAELADAIAGSVVSC
jgi:serine/threonine-protein kinase